MQQSDGNGKFITSSIVRRIFIVGTLNCDLTLASEQIATRTVKEWKRGLPDINKKPAIFLLHG